MRDFKSNLNFKILKLNNFTQISEKQPWITKYSFNYMG